MFDSEKLPEDNECFRCNNPLQDNDWAAEGFCITVCYLHSLLTIAKVNYEIPTRVITIGRKVIEELNAKIIPQ